jgi:hypothetical protein
MFVCEQCHEVVGPAVPQTRRVVERRRVRHPPRADAQWVKEKGRWKRRDDPGGAGWQIVRERGLCPRCGAEGQS